GEAKVSPAGRRRIKIKACGSAAAEKHQKKRSFFIYASRAKKISGFTVTDEEKRFLRLKRNSPDDGN
ncbi:hypothetical protein, partial [Flavobacterium sp.]|uniref:hypothetical protein n=1 Tax=Flavobacterium sp. TaxID=239 RepID=UPI0025BF5D6F